MRKLRSYWPVGVFLVSSIAHTDLAIVARPALQHAFGISLSAFVIWLLVFSSLQIWYEYWFYKWCRSVAITDVWAWLKNGFWDQCKARGFDQPISQIGGAFKVLRERWMAVSAKWQWRRHRVVAGTSYSALFAISVSPLPGIRGPAVMVCGILALRWGIVVLVLGNAIRSLYLVYGLKWVLSH